MSLVLLVQQCWPGGVHRKLHAAADTCEHTACVKLVDSPFNEVGWRLLLQVFLGVVGGESSWWRRTGPVRVLFALTESPGSLFS